jgi:streptogramin lyase
VAPHNAASLLQENPAMRQFYLVLSVLACLFASSAGRASEELSAENLTVEMRVHRLVHGMEFGFDSLWTVGSGCGSSLTHIDTASNEVTDFLVHGISSPQGIAIGEGALWISDTRDKAIFKIDPKVYSILQKIPVPMLSTDGSFGIGKGAIWAITAEDFDRRLTRLNSHSGKIEARIALPSSSSSVIVAYGSVWVTGFSNELYRIDPQTNTITRTIKLHDSPQDMAAGEESIWVLGRGGSSVERIDAESGEHLTSIVTGLPSGSANITVGGGYAWISEPGFPLAQIDPRTNAVLRKFVGGHGIGGLIRYGAGSLWIAGGRISRLRPPTSLRSFSHSVSDSARPGLRH